MLFVRALAVLSFSASSVFAADSAAVDYNALSQNVTAGFLTGFQSFVHNKSQDLMNIIALGAPSNLRDEFKKNITSRFDAFESKVIADITPAVTAEVAAAVQDLQANNKTGFETFDLAVLSEKVAVRIAPTVEQDLSVWASEQEKPLLDAIRAIPRNALDKVIETLQNIKNRLFPARNTKDIILHRRVIALVPLLLGAGKVILGLAGFTAVIVSLFFTYIGAGAVIDFAQHGVGFRF